MYNLTWIWEYNISEGLWEKVRKNHNRKFMNDKVIRTDFTFEKSPKVVIVKSLESLEEVEIYRDLSEISFNDNEKKVIEDVKTGIIKEGGYDGNQLLIRGMLYDDEKNIVYLEALKAKYSLLMVLKYRKFKENSKLYEMPLYKTGVLVALVSKDDNVVFAERNKEDKNLKFFSTYGGFLEADDDKQSLKNLVLQTSEKELEEEILGDVENEKKNGFLKQFAKNLNIKGVSIRKIEGSGVGTIEFIVKNKVNLKIDSLEDLIKNNNSKDKKEHTGNYFIVSRDPIFRRKAIAELTTNEYIGWFLYGGVLNVLENRNLSEILFNRPSKVVPTKFLKNPPRKSLTYVEKVKENEKQKKTNEKTI